MPRDWFKTLSIWLLLCLLCICSHPVTAKSVMSRVLDTQAPDCLQNISSAREGCEYSTSRFATDRTIPRARVIIPRGDNTTTVSNSTDTTNSTNSTTASTGSNSSAHTISIVVATVGLVFVGFLLYFAWQCIGCIRGSRSGKPVFGYVGV